MRTTRIGLASLLALTACGGDDGGGTTDSGSASIGSTTAPTTSSSGTGSGTDSASGGTSTTGGTSGTASATGSSTDATSGSGGVLFDVGGGTGGTTGAGCGDTGGGGGVDFSYIWIANSPEGTVSKIDTQTLVEEGRYQVRPQGAGLPSRTSVSLNGDVVVASRSGGVTKILAETDGCLDDNGTPGIQTSTGSADVLPWDTEECVAWYTDYAYASERAIAWTAGEKNEATCKHEGAKVWVGATPDATNIDILRLNGDTGVQEDKITIPGTTGSMDRSPYGGAVDLEGDFWVVNAYCNASLVEIRDDLTYDIIQVPQGICAYGLAVDSNGMIWIGGYTQTTARYDPIAKVWDTVQAQGLGIQEDAEGRMWLGAYGQNGVYAIDSMTMQVLDYVPLPTTGQSKGISIDFFGYVWVVSDAGTTAVRYDPVAKTFDLYQGLNSPYSYSDMTGWGLKNVAGPQG